VTWRPMDTLRIDTDFQFGYNDYSYTRIWPRQIQSYKVHANYKPRPWATIDGAIDIHENRDNVSEVNNLEHGRTYSFLVTLTPNAKWAYSVGYNFTDLYLQTYICFNASNGTLTNPAPPLPPLPTYPACAIPLPPPPALPAAPLGGMEFYANKQHYAYSDVMWKLMPRVTASVGYVGTFAGGTEQGTTLFLDPLQPAGTLTFSYQRPYGWIQIDIYKGLSFKSEWNYYGYNTKSPTNPSIPVGNANAPNGLYELAPIPAADFNGSTATFSIRYAF